MRVREVSDSNGPNERVFQVTLTLPHRYDLSAEYLREQCATVASVWRGVMSRLRWYAHRWARGDKAAAERVPPPRLRNRKPHPRFATTWDDSSQWGDGADRGIWVREVTPGGRRRGGRRSGWHVHIHALVRTRRAAELLNAAWQAEIALHGLCEHTANGWASTDITAKDAADAADYVSKYLAKGDVASIPEELHKAYVDGTKGFRRADAWGAWRPLGLAPQPGTAIGIGERDWSHAVDLATYYGEDSLGRWLRTGTLSPRAAEELCVDQLVAAWLNEEASKDADVMEASRKAALALANKLGLATAWPLGP